MLTLHMRRWVWGIVLLSWMGVIFGLSHQPGSGTNWEPPLWYILERKSAHVFEYAVLVILASIFLRQFSQKEPLHLVVLVAFLFTVSYGFLDEIHQSFIFGRGARLSDVFIDGLGALVGGAMFWWWYRWRSNGYEH